jgi:N-acetylneuraminic acid mutarotase
MIGSSTAILLASCTPKPNGSVSQMIKNEIKSGWSSSLNLPLAVQEIYPALHQDHIHQAGGFIATDGRISGPTTRHFSWAPSEDKWREEVPLPTARHHPHLISFKGQLMAMAGFESQSNDAMWIMQNSGWVLDKENQWQASSELPAPCGEAVMGITGDGRLHIAGGRTPNNAKNASWQDHGDTDHHFVLDNLYGSWEKAAPCLSKRNSAAGDVIDGALHIVGGRQVGGGNVTTHEVYDPKEDRWRNAAPMPQAQGGLAAAALGGKLYVFGGEYFDNGGGVYPESWVYNPSTDKWESLPDMPTPRHGLGAVTLGPDIYVIGGAKQVGGNQTSLVVERFKSRAVS